MSDPHTDLVGQTLLLMAEAGAPTSQVPGYAPGFELPVAATMPAERWVGICELAADSGFREEGRYSRHDVGRIQAEHQFWLAEALTGAAS